MDKKMAWIVGIAALIIIVILVRRGSTPATAPATDTDSKPAAEESMEKKEESANERGEVMEKKEGEAMEKKSAEGETKEEGPMSAEGGSASGGLSADLKLSAEALGGSAVKLTWSAPAGLNESNRFIIVRDELENPEHTGNNFWIRQSHLKREVVWEKVPTGAMHFRLCLTENDMIDVCTKYSNDVVVEVK